MHLYYGPNWNLLQVLAQPQFGDVGGFVLSRVRNSSGPLVRALVLFVILQEWSVEASAKATCFANAYRDMAILIENLPIDPPRWTSTGAIAAWSYGWSLFSIGMAAWQSSLRDVRHRVVWVHFCR